MVTVKKSTLAVIFILAGVISIIFGGIFVFEGFDKSTFIAQAMESENITYAGAGGDITGVINTPKEAQVMASVLKEHRDSDYGSYSQLKRDDPNRDQILKAMTLENSLNLAVLGAGLTDVVKASGAFMSILGIIFVAGGMSMTRNQLE